MNHYYFVEAAELGAKQEREACAKVCEGIANEPLTKISREHAPYMTAVAKDCAAAIRGRGQEESQVESQMTVEMDDKYKRLVDDLCLLHFGWNTDEQGVANKEARTRLWEHTAEVWKKLEIEALEKRLKELKDE